MPPPIKAGSVRENTTQLNLEFPESLSLRMAAIGKFLGLTKRATMIVIVDAGCSEFERKMLDAEAAATRQPGI